MTEFNCETTVQQMYAFVQGSMNDEVYFHFEEHIVTCANCEVAVESYISTTVMVTRSIPRCDRPIPADIEARLWAVFEKCLKE